MKRTRQVLVMTLMATALCADRVVTAAPDVRAQLQPAVDPIARLATKLSVAFRRVLPAVRLHQHRHEVFQSPSISSLPISTPAKLHATRGSVFEYRLPPPAV